LSPTASSAGCRHIIWFNFHVAAGSLKELHLFDFTVGRKWQ
jgi:hypothetical protein